MTFLLRWEHSFETQVQVTSISSSQNDTNFETRQFCDTSRLKRQTPTERAKLPKEVTDINNKLVHVQSGKDPGKSTANNNDVGETPFGFETNERVKCNFAKSEVQKAEGYLPDENVPDAAKEVQDEEREDEEVRLQFSTVVDVLQTLGLGSLEATTTAQRMCALKSFRSRKVTAVELYGRGASAILRTYKTKACQLTACVPWT